MTRKTDPSSDVPSGATVDADRDVDAAPRDHRGSDGGSNVAARTGEGPDPGEQAPVLKRWSYLPLAGLGLLTCGWGLLLPSFQQNSALKALDPDALDPRLVLVLHLACAVLTLGIGNVVVGAIQVARLQRYSAARAHEERQPKLLALYFVGAISFEIIVAIALFTGPIGWFAALAVGNGLLQFCFLGPQRELELYTSAPGE